MEFYREDVNTELDPLLLPASMIKELNQILRTYFALMDSCTMPSLVLLWRRNISSQDECDWASVNVPYVGIFFGWSSKV